MGNLIIQNKEIRVKLAPQKYDKDEEERILDIGNDLNFSKKMNDVNAWIKPVLVNTKNYRLYPNTLKDDAKLIHQSYLSDENTLTHGSLIHYVYNCWAREHNVVLRPDMIMYTILCEIARYIVTDPESVRHLYSNSNDKIMVSFDFSSFETLEDNILAKLKSLIANQEYMHTILDIHYKSAPEEFKKVIPAIFLYSATPFFSYCSVTCGIPEVIIKGDILEWNDVNNRINKLKEFIPTISKYLDKCNEVLNNILESIKNNDTNKMNNIFTLRANRDCLSGAPPVICNGWICDLYMNTYSMINKYNTHLAAIPYSHDGNNYVKIWGLCYSNLDNNTLNPQYGYTVYEILNKNLFQALSN